MGQKMTFFLFCISCTLAHGEGFRIDWNSVNAAAGVVQGGGYSLASSVGQAVTGFVMNPQYLHWIGFWSAEVSTPTAASCIGSVKTLPDGTYVAIVGKVATTSAADFAGFFYVEEQDRTSGLLVITPLSNPDISRGSIVNVIGTLGTTLSGERFITGSIVVVAGGTYSSSVPDTTGSIINDVESSAEF